MTAPVRPPSPIAIGWPLLPMPNAAGRLEWPDAESSVRQTIEAILRTRPGEQLMRPRFGGGLEDFVHEQNTLVTRRRIHDAIVDALGRWEPRIDLDRVEVWEVPDQPTHVRVEIQYRMRRTGATQQLGLTMSTSG
jgi:phage baseplate assembly protein W